MQVHVRRRNIIFSSIYGLMTKFLILEKERKKSALLMGNLIGLNYLIFKDTI